ncbi:MAG: 1,4-alpha-glucan branching protein GlgB [Clostridiales bacterium]|nr:1,4-alpha-glucan branching protein GlgB [Clostridiales bacterium]
MENREEMERRFHEGNGSEAYRYFGAHREGEAVTFRVWAPHARQVALTGDWNGWSETAAPMTRLTDGTWEITVSGVKTYDAYKYVITASDGRLLYKTDPFAFHCETRPETAGKFYELPNYPWQDGAWREKCGKTPPVEGPLNMYEVHLGSWHRRENGVFIGYRDLADELSAYVKELGCNFVELLPVTEHPLDDSWGYQCTGYYAPTSRYGTPEDFMYFVDKMHRAGIGVILDWVPAHFCKDACGLIEFDGTCLYEYSDPLKWEHAGWGTRVFDFGKPEVRSFLLSSAAFWLREYHIDGLRVDAVASMLYLDYDRPAGQWRPNEKGGKENWEAISFLRQLNRTAFEVDPAVLMVAEESTAWPMVTKPPEMGGLGFNLKWNMGWVNDLSHYLKMDPYFRQHHHRDVTFSMVYAFSENFVLPVSHDEVVHMKGSLRGKMPGDDWQQLAGVRGFYAYMLCHPGKKLTFMGTELGQWHEWDFNSQLDWYLLQSKENQQMFQYFKDANHFYKKNKPLWQVDDSWDGFEWLVADDNHNNVLVLERRDRAGKALILAVNFSPVTFEDYRFGVPPKAVYEEVFNTDQPCYGGSGVSNDAPIPTERIASHGKECSISVRIPPLGAVILKGKGRLSKKAEKKGE